MRVRRLFPLAVAAALVAACSVDVDGAPCAAPGETADCPGGQACGNDLRCSARALACGGSRCVPGTGTCDGDDAIVCTAADPVCGERTRDRCPARAMVCGTRRGLDLGACECPEPEGAVTVLVADPRGSPAQGDFPYPRGQAFPAECRYGRLGDALDAAAASTAEAVTVRIEGTAGASAVFGASETGEDPPLVVGPRVAAIAAGPAVLRGHPGLTGLAASSAILKVAGTVEGLAVEANGATGQGIVVECDGGAAAAALRRVTVSGGASFEPASVVTGLAKGVALTGASCANRTVRLEGVEVTGVSGPALELAPSLTTTVVVLGGSFRDSEIGIVLGGGHVTVAYDPANAATPTVSGNAGNGIVVGGTGGFSIDAKLERVLVDSNGGSGIVVAGVTEAASHVRLHACDVHANGGSTPDGIGTTPGRSVGGVVVKLANPATLSFGGNRLWSNAGDQLGIDSDASWVIGPAGGCGPESNVFACVADFAYAVSFAGGVGSATVSVPFNTWPGTTYLQFLGPHVDPPAPNVCPGDRRPTCP